MHVAGDYIRTFGVKKGEYVAKYEKKESITYLLLGIKYLHNIITAVIARE